MAIIHTYSDREQKKLKIKIYSSIAVIIGILILIYTLSTNIKLPKNEIPQQNTTQENRYFCINPSIKDEYLEEFELQKEKEFPELEIIDDSTDCEIEYVRNPTDTNPYTLISYQVYAIISNHKSEISDINTEILKDSLNNQKYDKYSIIWSKETDKYLRSKYEFGVGQTVYSKDEIEKRISTSTNYIAIIPFQDITLTSKVLTVNGKNVFKDDISITTYTLTDSFWFKATDQYKEKAKTVAEQILPKNNFEKEKISTILLTGTSAIGADQYNVKITQGKNSDYMISQIKGEIQQSEILHINNEVSIYNNCIQQIQSTYLCSLENDFNILKKLGVDVVGVNGNHIMDFGYNTYINTLNWYESNKIQYFGGGKSEEFSLKPAYIKSGNLKIAFLGYNFMPPYSYYARGNNGGSTNISIDILRDTIKLAKKNSDVVIADMNWATELQSTIDNSQREYSQKAHEFGADIVNGVSSYAYLGADISKNNTTFYGLGGFIHPLAKNGIMVRHIFYDKKYIAFELIPIKYAKDRVLQLETGENKEKMIEQFFKISRINYDKN